MKQVVLVLLGVSICGFGCKKEECKESAHSVTPSSATFDWKQCSDDKDRSVACEVSGQQWSCTCSLGGTKGSTFQLPFDGTASTTLVTGAIAKDKCAWSFAP